MSPASLKKADLVEMARELGLDFAASARKDKIESVIRDHLLSHREDVSRDKRFQLFSIPSRGAAARTSGSSSAGGSAGARRGSGGSDDGTPTESDDAAEKSEAESADAEEEPVLRGVRGRASAGVAHVKRTLRLYQQRTHNAVTSTFSTFQYQVSTVFAANVTLLAVEYVYLVYSSLPHSFFGTWQYGVYDAVDNVKHDFIYFTAVLVALPLLVTFAINFTKMDSIRRKKHVYLVDPVLFGVARLYISALLFVTNYESLRRYAVLAGSSGISSALIGVYASLLQTS